MWNKKKCDHVVLDEWFSHIFRRDVYKIIVDESFMKDKGEEIIKHLQSEKVFLYSKIPVEHISESEFLERLQFY